MLMNDKIIFDSYYCINSTKTKEIMVHYILQRRHIFMHVKSFYSNVRSRRTQILMLCVAPGIEHN